MEFELPNVATLRRGRVWDTGAALTCITTPNAPTGRGYATSDLEALVKARSAWCCSTSLREFAGENALELALRYPHVLVLRTFSKAYSLCYLRIGYAWASVLIAGLQKRRTATT